MAAKSIEAILRLSSDVAGALAGLRQVRAEAEKPIKRPTDAAGPAGGAAQATARATTDAERAATEAQKQEAAKRRAAQRAADAEALAAKKAALRSQAEAERAARRQQRQEDETELRRQRRVAAQAERDRLQATAAKARAEREERRKLTLVAPQVTDIVTQLAGGQNPALVALQQGGQLSDLFGGPVKGARALLSVLTPMRLVVGGIAGSLALFGVNLLQGYNESDRLRKSLALTGNAAGTSLGQVNRLAVGIAAATTTSIGLARGIVEGVLGLAGQTANTLGDTGRAAAALAKLTGASAEEAVKAFDDQSKGITDWAINANKQYNFLTAEQVAYIRRLESQGRVEEAVRFANGKLADTLQQRTAPALGTLERAWSAVTRAMSSFFDQIKAIGRDSTAEERLDRLQKKLDEIRARQAQPLFAGRRRSTDAGEVAGIQQEQNTLRRDQLRTAENAIDLRAAQEEIRQQTKQWQESLTALSLAEAQKRLAGQLAALDREQAAVELAAARGLSSERDKALALNGIEQRRLQAQLALQRQQAAAARNAVELEAKPEDRRNAQARAVEAEAQLVTTQARLQAAVADAQRITESAALTQSRERAQEWAQIWQQADQQVRQLAQDNALTDAARVQDPAARADAEAAVRVQSLRRQVEETARDLKVQIGLAISPEARDELRQQLGALLLEGSQAADELARRTRQQTLQQQAGDQLETLRLQEQALARAVQDGALTTEEAEQRKFEARAAALPQLRQVLQLLQALATTDAERNAVEGLVQQLDELGNKTTELQRVFRDQATSGLAGLFTDVATDIRSADEALGTFVANFARRMLELLNQRLAEKLIGQAVKALDNFAQQNQSQSGLLGFLANLASGLIASNSGGSGFQGVGASPYHSGGVVGSVSAAARQFAPWVFQGAQVLHSGGLAGLSQGEVPAILMKGEEVLRADDPRHRNNLKRSSGAALFGDFNVQISLGGGAGAGAGDQAQAQQLARGLKTAVQQYLLDEMRPGGLLQNVAGS
jgi:phage-related minor tail protein